MIHKTFNHILVLTVLACAGCIVDPQLNNEGLLNSTLWTQTSVEHTVATVQAFEAAKAAVNRALEDPDWTAALQQTSDYQSLPPAVIVDVDETILDNSPFQARVVTGGAVFSREDWEAWVRESAARALPGAKSFIEYLKERGVKLFYVTNRRLEAPTIENLRAVLDPDVTADDVLCKNEHPDWTSDKTSRRAQIAKTHRILLLVGDDYNDFAYLGKVDPDERARLAEAHRDHWGTKWILISNPMYGSWERSIWQYDYQMTHRERLKEKRKHLSTDGYKPKPPLW